MISTDSILRGAFAPINAPLTAALINTVGTSSAVLFTDLPFTNATPLVRRVRIVNTHATQSLALFTVALAQAPGAESVTSLNAMVVVAGGTESLLVESTQRILIVGSGAATTFQAVSADR